MLVEKDKSALKWAMQTALAEQAVDMGEHKDFVNQYVKEEATYEQLLNLCFNPFDKTTLYMESSDLETVVKFLVYEMKHKEDLNLTMDDKFKVLEGLLTTGELKNPKKSDNKLFEATKKEMANVLTEAIKKLPVENRKKKLPISEAAKSASLLYIYKKARNSGKTKLEACKVTVSFAKNCNDKNLLESWVRRTKNLIG